MIAHTDMNTIKDEFTQSLRLFGELPEAIERSISDFDRSHSGSISKNEARIARENVDAFVDRVTALSKIGNRMLTTMLYGDDDEVEILNINGWDLQFYQDHHKAISSSILRTKYAYFIASTKTEWLPHLSDLKYMERRSVSALTDFEKMSEEIQKLIPHFMEVEEDIVDFSPNVETSLQSNTILTPEWVKSGADYVKWVRSRSLNEV